MSHRIFVYGSLRKGLGLHSVLNQGNGTFVGTFTSHPKYNLHNLGPFPGLSKNGSTAIVGEIYEVDDNLLLRLDGIEGAYDRLPIELDDPNTQAEAYFLKRPHGELVMGGDWVEFVKQRNLEKDQRRTQWQDQWQAQRLRQALDEDEDEDMFVADETLDEDMFVADEEDNEGLIDDGEQSESEPNIDRGFVDNSEELPSSSSSLDNI